MTTRVNEPVGRPSFDLSKDQRATLIDLVCRGARRAIERADPGTLEVPLTRMVRKDMKRVKKERGITGLQVGGEYEVDDMEADGPELLGRIDVTVQFAHQFGDEEAVIAVEAKRVGGGQTTLNRAYVRDGVHRFVTGKYSAGHPWGFMLGYVIQPTAAQVVVAISDYLCFDYGPKSCLKEDAPHEDAALVRRSTHARDLGGEIGLTHVFMDASRIGAAS